MTPDLSICAGHGEEEGDICYRLACPGIIELEPLENCSCHLGHPPCWNCTNRKLFCPECDWMEEDF